MWYCSGIALSIPAACNHRRTPDDIKVLVTAFEGALQHLRLVNRKDPATSLVAERIIVLAQQSECDPSRCAMLVVLRTLRGNDHVL